MMSQIYTLAHVARRYGVSLRTIQREVRAGNLRPSLQRGRKLLCTREDLHAYEQTLRRDDRCGACGRDPMPRPALNLGQGNPTICRLCAADALGETFESAHAGGGA